MYKNTSSVQSLTWDTIELRPEGMVPWKDHLLCNHENLNYFPQHPCIKKN